MGQCNGCGDPVIPSVNNDAKECCELTPANCVVTSEYQNFFKIGVGKTLTYVIDTIAKYVKALTLRVDALEALHNYKTFTAILTQAGVAAPTAIIVDNKIGGTAVWAYVSPGVYTLTLTGAFAADKTIIELYLIWHMTGVIELIQGVDEVLYDIIVDVMEERLEEAGLGQVMD